MGRYRTAGVPGAGAADDQWDAMLVAQPRHGRDLIGRVGNDDEIGSRGDAEGVGRVRLNSRRLIENADAGQGVPQCANETFR